MNNDFPRHFTFIPTSSHRTTTDDIALLSQLLPHFHHSEFTSETRDEFIKTPLERIRFITSFGVLKAPFTNYISSSFEACKPHSRMGSSRVTFGCVHRDLVTDPRDVQFLSHPTEFQGVRRNVQRVLVETACRLLRATWDTNNEPNAVETKNTE